MLDKPEQQEFVYVTLPGRNELDRARRRAQHRVKYDGPKCATCGAPDYVADAHTVGRAQIYCPTCGASRSCWVKRVQVDLSLPRRIGAPKGAAHPRSAANRNPVEASVVMSGEAPCEQCGSLPRHARLDRRKKADPKCWCVVCGASRKDWTDQSAIRTAKATAYLPRLDPRDNEPPLEGTTRRRLRLESDWQWMEQHNADVKLRRAREALEPEVISYAAHGSTYDVLAKLASMHVPNPRIELLASARAGDEYAAWQCDEMFENWQEVTA